MSKTLELRKLIKRQLDTAVGETCYKTAPASVDFPYKVFSFETIDLNDISRDDIMLDVDIYTKDKEQADTIADSIEPLFNAVNIPSVEILPTFFRVSRKPIPDEDETINRIQLRFQIKSYERGK